MANVKFSQIANGGNINLTNDQVLVVRGGNTDNLASIPGIVNAVYDGANSFSSGTLRFSNSNGVSFGLNASTMTASVAVQSNQSIGFYATGNTTQNSSTTLDARSLTFNGLGGVTVGYSNGSIDISGASPSAGVALYDGANSITSGTARFTNANGVSFSINGQTISGSVAAQTNQTVGLYGLGNTTQNSSTTLDARSLSLNGLGIITVGYSNGSVQLSATTPSQTNQTAGLYAVGNTTQNSSTTLDVRTLSFDGLGAQTVGFSNGSIQFSVPAVSVLTGVNGISISSNGSTISVSYLGNSVQSNQTVGFYAVGNTTQNSSTTLDARTLSINGLGIITAGFSNGSIDISATQSAQSVGFYAVGNTTQNSSTTLDARTISFDGLGAQTVGYSNGSIQLSVPATSSLVGVNGISISTNGSTISVSYQGNTSGSMLSYYEPAMRGGTSTLTMANGTLYVQPFVVSNPVSAYQLMQWQQVTTQPTTTMSFSGQNSSATSSTGSANWIQSGTVLLFSRQSTGTVANSSNLISCGSNSYSFGVGYSASVSWSTSLFGGLSSNVTVNITTSGAASFISNINSTGGSSSGSFGTSGSTTFGTTGAVSTFSSSYIMSLASQMFSGVRPVFCPLGTSLTPGEYWLGNIISTGSASTNFPLQNVCIIPGGNVFYTSNTSAYAEIGSTATIAGSNIPVGWGSYSSSGNTTTTFAMSNISNMSNNQTWFAMAAWTK